MRWIKKNAYPLYLFLLGTIPLIYVSTVSTVTAREMSVVWISLFLFTLIAIMMWYIKRD